MSETDRLNVQALEKYGLLCSCTSSNITMDSFPEGTRQYTDQKAQQNCRAEPSHYGTTKSWKSGNSSGSGRHRGRRGGGGWTLRHRWVRQTLKTCRNLKPSGTINALTVCPESRARAVAIGYFSQVQRDHDSLLD